MKVYKLLFVFLFTFIIITTNGQEVEKQSQSFLPYKWRAGVGAGFTSGLGLSLKYQPKKTGVQLNFIPYFDDFGRRKYISLGLTFSQELWHSEKSAFLAYFSNSFTLNESKYYSSSSFNTGIGVGYEAVKIDDRLVLDLMLGYAQYNSFERLFLTGEIAIHFLFAKKK